MASTLSLTIKLDDTQANAQDRFQLATNKNLEAMLALSNLFRNLATGHDRGIVDVQTGSAAPVAASGTLTLDTVIATDACTVGTITFTGTDTPSTSLHFDTAAGSDTLIAASLASAINAHATTSKIVHATSSGAVVTITALVKGEVGNQIALSSADATITASASHLASGAGGATETATSYTQGIA